MTDKAIITFVKNPVAGKVKTRLAKTIGDAKALEMYLALCKYTRETMLTVDCSRYVYYDQAIIQKDEWKTSEFEKQVQHPGNLGDRILHAFEDVLKHHSKVLIIGSDCPQIKQDHIDLAFDSLDETDLVIGPTLDGGYYLLGLKQSHPALFTAMPWSTAQVYGTTLERIFENDLSITELEKLSDVDVEDDLKYVGWL